jgi:putative hydrolase of the HAD superfamily
MAPTRITTLFLDIGGVLLTNGWDRVARARAAAQFALDLEELDERHHMTFDTYESGKLSLDEYLTRVVFHRDRPFSREAFRAFMFAQSQPLPEMIDLVRALKARHGLTLAAVSNEGRELTLHRIRAFGLQTFMDFFIASCFVRVRKPDPDIYRIALDIAQAAPADIAYIDDRPMFVEVARGLGLHGIRHADVGTTRAALADLGLSAAG